LLLQLLNHVRVSMCMERRSGRTRVHYDAYSNFVLRVVIIIRQLVEDMNQPFHIFYNTL